MDQELDDDGHSGRQIGLLNDDDYEGGGSSHQPPPLPPPPPAGLLSFSSYTKFNISPNRPNANAHLEFKSIERPRSHSPLKPRMGIDQYVETYKSTSATNSSNENKIMMNLRMDDLLASSKSGAAQYQAIDELGFMNANEPDVVYGSKRNSIADKSGFRSRNSQSEEDENDADAEDIGVENEYEDVTASSLKYKYTATYRKDETTGSFQEESKIVFEKSAGAVSKPSRPPPPPPPPSSFSSTSHTTSSTSYQHRDLPPPPSPPLDHSKDEVMATNPFFTSTNQVSAETTRTAGPPLAELNSILAALNANSQKLESKIEHEEDMRPSSNVYIDATSSSIASTTTITETIKQKNESFFNDILSKSDDLIAQTQNKLERLSKLDTVAKPIGPVLSTTPVAPKAKPVPSQVPNAGTPPPSNNQLQHEQQVPPPPPRVSPSQVLGENTATNQANLLSSQSSNIIPSKSLIDFKADGSNASEPTQATGVIQNQMIDLLLDISQENPANSTLVLSTEPMKQNESYFDLIGLNKSNSQFSLTGGQQASGGGFAPPGSSLLELLSEESSPASAETLSNYKDDLLDSMLGTSEPPLPPPPPLPSRPAPPPPPSSLNLSNVIQVEPPPTADSSSEYTVPTIDILITEPQSEKDDDNIVPEGYFNLMHDVPKDQSRPHSPVSSPSTMPSAFQSSTSYVSKTTTTKPAYSFKFGVGQTTYDASMSRARPRPVSPVVQQRPPTPPSRSRPASPLISPSRSKHSTILEDDLSILNGAGNELNELEKSVNYLLDNSSANTGTAAFDQDTIKKKKKRNKNQVFTSYTSSSQASSQNEESSSSSEEDEKFQIKIRPKAGGSLNQSDNMSDAVSIGSNTGSAYKIPLLPRPPRTAQEIEELRQRRMSSDSNASITRSIKSRDDESSSDSDAASSKKPMSYRKRDEAVTTGYAVGNEETKTTVERRESTESDYLLELPDEDDSAPLADFNEKTELKQYSDGSYSVVALVRQPFRAPHELYKNALQKMTEVRTWTECLVKLVDVPPKIDPKETDPEKQNKSMPSKKLVFYNFHDLMSLATQLDSTVEKLIEAECSAQDEKIKQMLSKKLVPFHEIEIKSVHKFSEMSLQQYDTYTKIHTFKIQEPIYKETVTLRSDRLMALPEKLMKRFTKPKTTSILDHTAIPLEVCKFAHLDYGVLKSFWLLLQDVFWSMPTITRKEQRKQQLEQINLNPTGSMSISAAAASLFSLGTNKAIQGPTLNSVTSSHVKEQVTVKVIDEYKCKLDKECRIMLHKSRTRVFLVSFLNDTNPFIEVGMNDCLRHGKEIVGRYDIIPVKTEQWISPEAFELNENIVNKEEFDKTHLLKCVQMPDNVLVELMRYRTRPRRNYELPLRLRCYFNMVNRRVEIRIECTVGGSYFNNLSEVYCEDIQIRFPLPDLWVYLFRVEKRFRYGAVHSSKHKFGKLKGLDRFMVHKSSLAHGQCAAVMEASCGMAKYEQAFKSLVWRIDQLPTKSKDIYKTHLFICKFGLQEYDSIPEKFETQAYAQYGITTCATSKSQVRSISVSPCSDDTPPDKWVKLKAKFEYEVDINYSNDQDALPVVDKEMCAEVQQLQTQTESEGDNNEEEEDDD